MRQRPELVVFDWDGTLMDSVGTIVSCTRATLDELGLPQVDEELIRGSVGLSVAETVRRLSGGDPDPADSERLQAAYRRNWFETFRDRPALFAGAAAMLERLEAAGHLLAVATGKSRRGLDHDLAATALAGRFHATRTADESRSKPNPQMLFDLLDELGVRRERALMVGDSIWDLRMAAAARVPAIAVATGAHPLAVLEEEGPAGCLGGIVELEEWLAGS